MYNLRGKDTAAEKVESKLKRNPEFLFYTNLIRFSTGVNKLGVLTTWKSVYLEWGHVKVIYD